MAKNQKAQVKDKAKAALTGQHDEFTGADKKVLGQVARAVEANVKTQQDLMMQAVKGAIGLAATRGLALKAVDKVVLKSFAEDLAKSPELYSTPEKTFGLMQSGRYSMFAERGTATKREAAIEPEVTPTKGFGRT